MSEQSWARSIMRETVGFGLGGCPDRLDVDQGLSRTAGRPQAATRPTDLTDEEWKRIAPLLPAPSGRSRPSKADLREVLDVIRYTGRLDCRMLPVHLGPCQTVYRWLQRFVRCLLCPTIHDIALMLERKQVSREACLSAGVLDSQTVKAPHARRGGYDAAKRTKGPQASHRCG